MPYHAVGEVFTAHLDELDRGGALVLRGGRHMALDGLCWPAVGNAVLCGKEHACNCNRSDDVDLTLTTLLLKAPLFYNQGVSTQMDRSVYHGWAVDSLKQGPFQRHSKQ